MKNRGIKVFVVGVMVAALGLGRSIPGLTQNGSAPGRVLLAGNNNMKISPVQLALFEEILANGGNRRNTNDAGTLSPLAASIQAHRIERRQMAAASLWGRIINPAAAGGEFPLASPLDAERSPSAYAVFNLEFDSSAACERFAVPGVSVFNRFDRWADVFVPYDGNVLRQVLAAPGLAWSELAESGVLPPPPIAEPTPPAPSKGQKENVIHGGRNGLTGKGVVLAVIDTGIDFHHPDFITYDKDGRPTSRILAFWDTTSEAYGAGVGKRGPISYPNGAPVGTVYSRDDLTRDLRSARSRISAWDTDGHGTACAGIAAGNGNAFDDHRYAGVAPNADIIAIRIAYPGGNGLANAYLLNAICAWVDKVAGSRPAVVSCSFGGQFSGRDGQTIEERQLSARFNPDRKGRAICIAAGNEGDISFHAETSFKGADVPGTINIARHAWMEMYFDTADAGDIVLAPVGNTAVKVLAAYKNPLSNQTIAVVDARGAGLRVYNKSGKSMHVDAYADQSNSFSDTSASVSRQIASPGSAENAITVGSYDWNDIFNQHGHDFQMSGVGGDGAMQIGALSGYSNPGPSRIPGVVKPDLVAPGQYYSAPYSMNVPDILYDEDGQAVFSMRDTSGFYQLFNGTSAATPYTAGVLALLFEKKPALTLAEFRDLLHHDATRDSNTGDLPNSSWGYGKLNIAAVDAMIKALR